MKEKYKKYIGNKAFYMMVMAIAVPIMIQNGLTNFVNLLDNIMVGRLGTEEMSGVSIVNQIIFMYFRRNSRCGNLYRPIFRTKK